MVNLAGSVGGKYGAKTHLSAHLRRKILQAAQGLITTGVGVWGGDDEEELGDWELSGVDEVVVFVSVLDSISFELASFGVCVAKERLKN